MEDNFLSVSRDLPTIHYTIAVFMLVEAGDLATSHFLNWRSCSRMCFRIWYHKRGWIIGSMVCDPSLFPKLSDQSGGDVHARIQSRSEDNKICAF
ncbi:hypothetical protein AAHA92_26318 [Salvia divinorum]|uniref:Uncharacterized protein n=1 Tax=Salvia divinorum TaxID=28513 RepID=A0ABD1GDS9_SALDI